MNMLNLIFETETIDLEKKAEKTALCCFAAEDVKVPVFANVTFVDDEEIHRINLEQRNVDRSTDVLSFPTVNYTSGKTARDSNERLLREYDPEMNACFLGDIIVSVPHARQQAKEYGHSEEREILYLITHGLFHLMGYDHMTDSDKEVMRAMEEKALNAAGENRVTDDELIKMAWDAMQFSYSPYSKYKVGAALLCKDGKVYTGCNIENASYGATNCAERTALFKAVSEGEKEFITIAITSEKSIPWPCGICRQALAEFAPDLRVIAHWPGGTEEMSLSQLLPGCFAPSTGLLDILGKD